MTALENLTDGQLRLQKMVEGKHSRSPCGESLSLPVVDGFDDRKIWYAWDVDPKFLNSNGSLFGGYISALMDDAVGHAGCTSVPDGYVTVTADLRVSFFRPISPVDGPISVEAEIVNQSRRQMFAEAHMLTEKRKLIAKATGILAIVPKA